MIRPLRRRHRFIVPILFVVLALVALAVVASGFSRTPSTRQYVESGFSRILTRTTGP